MKVMKYPHAGSLSPRIETMSNLLDDNRRNEMIEDTKFIKSSLAFATNILNQSDYGVANAFLLASHPVVDDNDRFVYLQPGLLENLSELLSQSLDGVALSVMRLCEAKMLDIVFGKICIHYSVDDLKYLCGEEQTN